MDKMKVVDINDGKYPPKKLLEKLINDPGNIESLIVLEITKDGELLINHTDMSYLEAIGYMRIAEQQFIELGRGSDG